MKRRDLLRSLATVAVGAAAIPLSNLVEARVGRPATPGSVAGVRRRTRGGVSYYYCGGIWYQPTYQGSTVVYVVTDIESGANTNLEFYE